MSYLLTLHHDEALSLASTSGVVPASELPLLPDAFALTEQLSALIRGQQAQLAEAESQARQQGEQAGHQAGMDLAREESAQALAEALADIAQQQNTQRDELRQALTALATAIVRRMALDLAPEQVLAGLAARAFEHVVPPQPVRLRLPPDMVDPVRAQLDQRELHLPVQCVPDETLSGLRCQIESPTGTLLAGLDDMLALTTERLALSQRAHTSAAADNTRDEALPENA